MKNVKEDRRREKRNRILDEAGKLFVSNGIESTKIIDIAKAAGVAKGTVYEYFESKDDIVIEWMNEIFERFRSGMAEKLEKEHDAVSKLRVFLEHSAEEFTSIMVNTKMMVQDRFINMCRSDTIEDSLDKVADDRVAAIVFQNIKNKFDILDDIITEGQRSGEFREDIDRRMMPFLILSLLPFLGMTRQPNFPTEYVKERFGFIRPQWNSEGVVSYIVDGIGKRV